MLGVSREEISRGAAATWGQRRFYKFDGSMRTCGMLELRALMFDEVDKIIGEFCGQYGDDPRFGAVFGFGGNPDYFPVGWRGRWCNLEALQWMVWERARGEREGPGPFYQSGESALGGPEESWVYGFIPERVIKWMLNILIIWGEPQSEKVEVRKLLRPWLLRLHGTLVVGCYALMVMYEAEIVEWCESTSHRYDMGFFSGIEEASEGNGGEEGADHELTQQSIDEGEVRKGAVCMGVMCVSVSRARVLEPGASVCAVCAEEIDLRRGMRSIWKLVQQAREVALFGGARASKLVTSVLDMKEFRVIARCGGVPRCSNEGFLKRLAGRAGVPLRGSSSRVNHGGLVSEAVDVCSCTHGMEVDDRVVVGWRGCYGGRGTYMGGSVARALGDAGSVLYYWGRVMRPGPTGFEGVVVVLDMELTRSFESSRVGRELERMDGEWVQMPNPVDDDELVYGRVMCTLKDVGYWMEFKTGTVYRSSVVELDNGWVEDAEEIIGSAESREVQVGWDNVRSVKAVRGQQPGEGEVTRNCSTCRGVKVGWASEATGMCFICQQSGGPGVTCIRCGVYGHVREQVYVHARNSRGLHISHAGASWVVMGSNGELEVKTCGGVHQGRWVNGLCPMCCAVLVEGGCGDGGGAVSEETQERLRLQRELVAANLESTAQRASGGGGGWGCDVEAPGVLGRGEGVGEALEGMGGRVLRRHGRELGEGAGAGRNGEAEGGPEEPGPAVSSAAGT